jgi:formylglycine-generating enzyme required for sulfatase activity
MLLFAANLTANNIQVSNISLTGENTTADYVMVQFDISWENSWHFSTGPANWDAAWVFAKYRVGTGEWQHATLNSTGHSGGSGTGTTITPAPDGTGAFIYRSADGTGTFSIAGAQLRWNYGANGVADNATVDVKVFAFEMVYVPQGNFTVGTTGFEYGVFTAANDDSSPYTPFTITSTTPTLQGNNSSSSSANLSATGGFDLTGTNTASLASGFPTGYAGFYCQKYEITQQQYVDFLNTLTQTQANNRKYTGSTYRYAITGSTIGSYATTNPYVACNYLSWMDGAAYTDWAGLRPMTELEYEKACRGIAMPVADEYAWGTTVATAANNITNPGASNETTSTSGANAVINDQPNVQGPMRVGVFATGSSTRTQSGASYWGIMELSSNLKERAVTVGNATGRSYTGVHGNGALSANGHANATAWPGLSGGEVTNATGSGSRGVGWSYSMPYVHVSDRDFAAVTATGRIFNTGFRVVRSAP